MSTILFQNATADGAQPVVITGDGAPLPLRCTGTFSTANITARVSTPLGISNVLLDLDDTNQSLDLHLFAGETATLDISGADGSTNISAMITR